MSACLESSGIRHLSKALLLGGRYRIKLCKPAAKPTRTRAATMSVSRILKGLSWRLFMN